MTYSKLLQSEKHGISTEIKFAIQYLRFINELLKEIHTFHLPDQTSMCTVLLTHGKIVLVPVNQTTVNDYPCF